MTYKTLIVSVLCIAMTTVAATYEENLALSRTPTNEITIANAEVVVDACIAVTNSKPIIYCIDNKLVRYDKIIEKAAENYWLAGVAVHTAKVSSDDALRTSTINMLVDLVKTRPNAYNATMHLAQCLDICDGTNTARRIEIAESFYNAGLVKHGTIVAFYYIRNAFKPKKLGEYANYLKQRFDVSYNECIVKNTNDEKNMIFGLLYAYLFDNNRNFDRMLDGVNYAVEYFKHSYNSYGGSTWIITNPINHPFFNACRKACLSSNNLEDQLLFKVAIADCKALNTNTAFEELYSKAKLCKTRVDCALALNDVDKLIDTFKTIDDTIDATTIDKVVFKFNAINAGYRTEDLKLALKNINKKYTLKLYDNYDVWEPILSKIRAIIDVL